MNSKLEHFEKLSNRGTTALLGVITAAAAMLTGASALIATSTIGGAMMVTTQQAEAQSVRMNNRQSRSSVARNTRQITRRHFYALPRGYRWVTYGRYRYCYHGGRYYYPYMSGGRTVYIQVNVSSSNPAPPSSSQVIVNVN